MAIITLRPNGINYSGGAWTRVGGTGDHTVLADDDNQTYLKTSEDIDAIATEHRFNVGNITLPSGSLIRAVRTRAKSASQGCSLKVGQVLDGNVRYDEFPVTPKFLGIYTVFYGPWHRVTPGNGYWSKELVDSLRQSLRAHNVQGETHVSELYIDVEHFGPHTVQINALPDPVVVTSPTVSWTVSHLDNLDQEAYEIKVTGTDFSWSSGIVQGTATSHKIPRNLENGSYSLEVRVKTNWGGFQDLWSSWASRSFDVFAPVPGRPSVSILSTDNSQGFVAVQITAHVGTTNSNEFLRLERSTNNGPWETVVGAEELPAGPGVSVVFTDHMVVPKRATRYRARGIRYTTERLVGSPTIAPIPETVLLLKDWFLKDPTGTLSALKLDVEQSDLDIEEGEDKAAFNPLGRVGDGRKTGSIVVKDSLRGDKFSVTAGMVGDADYDKFKAFRYAQRPLVLQAPVIDGMWHFVFDSPIRNKILNMNDPVYRQITFDVIEV